MNDHQAVAGVSDETRGILEKLHTNLGSSFEETALVLGRTPEEIEAILNGEETGDEDLAMKVRGIADERGIAIEKRFNE